MQLTLNAARSLRDGAIDAAAALNEALREVLDDLPAEAHGPLREAIGRAMSAIFDEALNPAVEAFPELKPDEATWVAVALARAAKRAAY